MVVREHAAVDARRSQAWHIPWVHAVMNTFRWPKIAADCDAGLKIDDTESGLVSFQTLRASPQI